MISRNKTTADQLPDSIYKQILQLSQIHYYHGEQKIDEILDGKEKAREFIRDYFQAGEKEAVTAEWMKDDSDKIQARKLHATNVYFICLILSKQLEIDHTLVVKSNHGVSYNIKYLLYLTCLAHDMGYMYEVKSKEYGKIHKDERCVDYYGRNKIPVKYITPDLSTRDLGKQYGATENLDFEIEYTNGTKICKSKYSRELKEKYFKYRSQKMKKLDHGIIGADILYSKLVENYLKKYEESGTDDINYFRVSEVVFCSELFSIYAYIADCVGAHNIFKADINQISIYQQYELYELLPENFEKISYKENPLLFLLCVADTLEPYKRFEEKYENKENKENKEILKNICFKIDKEADKITLYVCINEQLNSSENESREKYINDIRELESWCDIHVKINE